MRTCHRLLGFVALGCLLAPVACGEGLESVTTIQSICTDEARLAVQVAVFDPDNRGIESVTATLESEQQCYLERPARLDDGDDAGAADAAHYACWEQGGGTYVVQVIGRDRTWTESVEVAADECHVTGPQPLTFELD